eukprot:CAMPEP_0172197942 /NCGR_PEP_ID=MMETSP1050-20130122/27786_1 /TAXON_ID=233186 /ORGANISM="Cryptomonas curvata, Strain CCAP979/52" /LENGTH=100 /DNA_ID=CAMNT_0012874657 /DNA_START=40 /DNA_END=338 /DNA_ORIENTATION=+
MKPSRESLAGFKSSAKKVGDSARQSLAGLESGARDVGTGAMRAVGRFSEGFPLMRKDLTERPAPPPRTTSRDRDQGGLRDVKAPRVIAESAAFLRELAQA